MGSRVVTNGCARTDLILSAHLGSNARVFPRILDLYLAPGSRVADVTYGRGAFWREVPEGRYEVLATDLETGTDCRDLPYAPGSVDCVVLDPPYMHSPGGRAYEGVEGFEKHYRNNQPNGTGAKYHDAVLALYAEAGAEAWRVLRERGVLIVKCQDEVCSNRQRLTHLEIAAGYQEQGFVVEDLFVVVRTNSPGVSRVVRQVHARKNHSYFLVAWKGKANRAWKPPMSALDLFLQVIQAQTKKTKWSGSPLESFRHVANTTRGEIGEKFIRRYLASFGIDSAPGGSRISETDMQIGPTRFEIKTASEDLGGSFQFNHVRLDREWHYLLCLGVRPAGLVFGLWAKGAVAEGQAGKLVRMAEGQSVTFKLTRRAGSLQPIEGLPTAIRSI